MDSPASAARGRGRASARKRHTLPVFPSSHPNPSAMTAAELVDQLPSSTPAVSIASSSFETPSPTASRGTRGRARVAEGAMPSSDDPDNKGGRSLRKRARVDYTFDHADEYVSEDGKITPSSTRAFKRRRTEGTFDSLDDIEVEFNDSHIKRRSPERPLPPLPPPALRRRFQARKSTIEFPALASNQQMEDVEVQDTIEVGGHHSEQSDGSTLRRASSNTSSGFSNEDSKPSHMTSSFASFPTPRKSHSTLVDVRLGDNRCRNDVEMSKAIRASLADDAKRIIDVSSRSSFEHLTPYIEGAFSEWPPAQFETEPAPGSQLLQQDTAEEMADDQLDGAQLDGTKADIAQEDTPMTDPLMPESTPVDGPMDTPAMSPLPTDTRANSPTADIENPYMQQPKQPISFQTTRNASDFISLFENHKSLSPEEVWIRLEVVNRALVAWQNEYNELRKITDDEDNAVRYRQEEAAFDHRLKMLTSKDPVANPIRKDFVVKGTRADRPNPEVAYVRHQDKLMAINYGFEYDERDSKIGYQDPLEQKTGSGKGRLRDRPKQTAKAAEADDGVVIHGKRTRKPPALFDGSEVASRGSSPVPMQRRRRRVGHNVEENGEANLAVPMPTDSFTEPAPPKKKGKGGRPRKHPLPAPIPEDTSAPAEELRQQPDQVGAEVPTRKRRRRRTAAEIAEQEAALATNGPSQQAPKKAGLRRTDSRLSEVPTSSFYTSSMQSTNAVEESRPPTSSSTATQSTVASNYQFREKRQKKFSINPDEEVHNEQPKPKRGRRPKKTQVEDFAATAPVPVSSPPSVQQPPLELHPTPKPPTKIKLKNYTAPISAPPPPPVSLLAPSPFSVPSSSNSTPPHSSHGTNNSAVNGTDPTDIKDYNQMTKSEKMSHSMKARWASGSMSQAVAKRRATLANKKQAVKASEPGQPLEPTSIMTELE